jgi:hypothetical protein
MGEESQSQFEHGLHVEILQTANVVLSEVTSSVTKPCSEKYRPGSKLVVSELPMLRRHLAPLSIAILSLTLMAAPFLPAQANHDKSTWNYDGGLQMMTDGSIPAGPCFRLTGRATAPEFFENLKREDSKLGVVIHRGNDIVTEFPEKLHLAFMMYDMPCPDQMEQTGNHAYLTPDAVSTLRLRFFWKHGMELRPVAGIVQTHAETRRIPPYATELANELPTRLEWLFEFDVRSAGVPVSDSLVVVMRTPDGHICARAAARM